MEKWEEAYKDYLSGMKTKDIAEKYGVTVSAVKSWKSRKWTYMQAEKDIEVAQKDADAGTQMKKQGLQPGSEKRQAEKKKRGAPKGNQNAVGNHGGPPKGSKNALTHGIYEKLIYNLLPEDEKKILNEETFDERSQLIFGVQFSNLQIYRFTKKIKELEEKGGLVVHSLKNNKSKDRNGNVTFNNTQTETIANHNLIIRYNEEIEKAKKTRLRYLDALLKPNAVLGEPDFEDDGFIEALKGEVEETWDDWNDESKDT